MKHYVHYQQCLVSSGYRKFNVAGILWCIAVIVIPLRGRADATAPTPTVMFVGNSEVAVEDDEQFRAIRAQLSGTPVQLERHIADLSAAGEDRDRVLAATRIVDETGASMVFWIEDNEIVRTFYFIPEKDGGRIIERTLRLETSSRSSRIEFIAVAVSGMVEKLLVTHQIAPAPPLRKKPPPPPLPKPDPVNTEPAPRQWAFGEVSAAYSGLYFDKNTFGHGLSLGLGLLPLNRFVIALAYCQVFPLTIQNELLQFTLTPRLAELSFAARILVKPIDVRLGAAWIVDIRSFSAKTISEVLQHDTEGVEIVHSLSPFVSMSWVFAGRIGIFARADALIGVNEAKYVYTVDDEPTTVLKPFLVKLRFTAGMLIKI